MRFYQLKQLADGDGQTVHGSGCPENGEMPAKPEHRFSSIEAGDNLVWPFSTLLHSTIEYPSPVSEPDNNVLGKATHQGPNGAPSWLEYFSINDRHLG